MLEFDLRKSTSMVNQNLYIDHKVLEWGKDNKQIIVTKAFAKQGLFLQQQRELSQQHAVFNFCFQGNQKFKLSGNYQHAYGDNTHHSMLILPSEKFTLETESNFEITALSLILPMSSFAQIMNDYLPNFPINYLNCMEALNRCYFKKYPWSPRLKDSIKNIMHPVSSPVSSALYLESRMLEMLALIFDHLVGTHNSELTGVKINKKHEEKIYAVKEILDKNLLNPPGLQQLAKQVGTNVFTLKSEFKAIFGLPIFQWVIKQKLALAADLIKNTTLSIQEVATTVGYENTSAFTRAFKQHHKTLPSNFKK